TEGVTFRTPREVLRFLYCHEWMHWYLRERLGRKSAAETTCDRFALRNYRWRSPLVLAFDPDQGRGRYPERHRAVADVDGDRVGAGPVGHDHDLRARNQSVPVEPPEQVGSVVLGHLRDAADVRLDA